MNELTRMFPYNLRAVRDVSLPESMEMHMESEGYAQIAMSPSEAAYDEIMWSSSNPDVATVDEYGIIHSHGEGVAEISALVCQMGMSIPPLVH